MSETGQFTHFDCRRTAFQSMSRPKNFIDSFFIGRILFDNQNITLQLLYLLFRFTKKVFQ